jgi:A/G-specific adenine glycosylase
MDERKRSAAQLPVSWRRTLAQRLLGWFEHNARNLPWRQTKDRYAIWVSEVMLQQTQVTTVVPYWERFLARFPSVVSLASADEQEVLWLWEGLGYYRRARQLHAAARKIVQEHGGQFPADYSAVRELPGIGRYTAGAILSIGCDQRLPILEANTIRVLSRLTAFGGDASSSAGQKHLWSLAEQILPAKRCGAFNQALMELGSEICTARSPGCDRCPVAGLCEARRRGLADRIPGPGKRMNYEDATEIAVVVCDRGRVLLRQCQRGERWAGLWDFPRFAADAHTALAEQIALRTQELTGVEVAAGQQLATFKHGVTRFRITLHCYAAARQSPARRMASGSRWVARAALAEYPLSTTGRKISRLLER